MGNKKNMHVKDTDVISASEIGQYHFCSKAWHLQRCGYEPKSPMLEIGTKKHIELLQLLVISSYFLEFYFFYLG
jgi:hypothetical protein